VCLYFTDEQICSSETSCVQHRTHPTFAFTVLWNVDRRRDRCDCYLLNYDYPSFPPSPHTSAEKTQIELPRPLAAASAGHTLSLSSALTDGLDRTEFILSAWRTFTPPTATEDRKQYSGPKISPDVRLECKWDAIDDPKMERQVLRRACVGMPIDEFCVC
jgi:hypothetical protein